MKIKITLKYEVRYGEEVYEFETLEHAERKLKSMRGQELEAYLVRQEFENNKLKDEIYVG